MESLIPILYAIIFFLILIIAILAIVYVLMNRPQNEKKENELIESDDNTKEKREQQYGKYTGVLTTNTIYEFMEFEDIIDNMIVRKNGTQYIMVLQCNGVNYDLMSEDEKVGVEEGFVQFLNTLRYPIQLYIQSRTLNLRDIIAEYKSRVEIIVNEIEKIDAKIAQAQMNANKALKEKLEFEKRKKENVLEYGISITDYVEKLSANKNILQQKTYVVVSYYSAEIGGGLDKYSKEEIYNMCFSELYTRCQNIASALATSQVTSRILDSEELAELLYIAYNRDESELLQFSKALDSQYDALYSTGKDVLQKRQEKIDREINIQAIDLATDSILKADKLKELEDIDRELEKSEKIREKAIGLIEQYEEQLDPRVFELAKEQVDNEINDKNKKIKNSKTPELDEGKDNKEKKKIVKRKKTEN